MNYHVDIDRTEIKFSSNKVTIFYDNCYEIMGKLTTCDVVEAVSFMTKIDVDSTVWDIKIEDCTKNTKPINCLYWLSGGDKFWTLAEKDWIDNIDNYSDRFKDFKSDFIYCKSLGDIRDIIYNKYNLDVFYEYYLSL